MWKIGFFEVNDTHAFTCVMGVDGGKGMLNFVLVQDEDGKRLRCNCTSDHYLEFCLNF